MAILSQFISATAKSSEIDVSAGDVIFDGSSEISWTELSPNLTDPQFVSPELWTKATMPPHVGPGTGVIWYKINLVNSADRSGNFAFFSTDAYVAEHVYLKVIRDNGRVDIAQSGTALSMSERSVKSRAHVLPFEMGPLERVTAYIGIQSLYTRNLLYQIRSENSWQSYDYAQTVFFGFYFGVLAFVSFVILGVYFKMKETLALAYAVFCGVMLVATFVGLGFANRLIPIDSIFVSGPAEIACISFVLVSIGWFTREFLEVKKWSMTLWWYYTGTSIVAFGSGLVALTGNFVPEIARINDFWIQFSGVVSLAAGIYAARTQKTPYAVSFLWGIGAYMTGGILWNLEFTSKIPSTWLTFHGLFFAQICQNIIFAFAIIKQLRNKIVAGIEAQQAANYGEKMGNLVRVLTHDMSNYMTIIQGNAFMLSGEVDLDQKTRAMFTQKIFKALKQQKEVLDSIKELKSIEDGKSEIQISETSLSEVLEDLSTTFEHRLSEKQVNLNIEIPVEPKVIVLAESRTLFHSVICNLVSNAIKFSQENQSVDVKVEQCEDTVKLHVVDHGVGIPDSLLTKLFDRNEKTSRPGTSGEKGTGFGLPICKAYMSMYGGDIVVTSRTEEQDPVDHGTTFTLVFKKAS